VFAAPTLISAEVDHFAVEQRGFSWGMGTVHLCDGRVCPNNTDAEYLVQQLNGRLRRARERASHS
jgi:hypothetical protein